MTSMIAHIRRRQRVLRAAIEYKKDFEAWEESCVPSYCHPNPAAAYVSWLRLFAAADLSKRVGPPARRALDFGSSIGELGHLLPNTAKYDFIEELDAAAEFLIEQLPDARRTTLEGALQGSYDRIFAIDSLEHNASYRALLTTLITKLAPGGVFILSGPTENRLYKLGRKIAGFEGHYHETNIHAIEAAAGEMMSRLAVKTILPIAPLFRVTAWTAK
ncbi:class I SAM-dependent methyltransferase [Sphingomonas sp. RB56-2]|uniref:Class I SAM-dependent methyltransferase n=1 Tax=Sphingomonas brevis TaxID=2908206 RepID=A0ABT0SAM5_9SPHN|nr:methyltransferase domain-containing protein [Sphingomonas brevis]MCL6741398.1 class I SAM-dependent methyltransferase [Sphingomonas brevis]